MAMPKTIISCCQELSNPVSYNSNLCYATKNKKIGNYLSLSVYKYKFKLAQVRMTCHSTKPLPVKLFFCCQWKRERYP